MYFSNDSVYDATAITCQQNPTLMCISQASSHKIFLAALLKQGGGDVVFMT